MLPFLECSHPAGPSDKDLERDYSSRDCLAGLMLVDPLCDPFNPAATLGAKVFFEAGARTAWHRKPAQTLIVISGSGRIQRAGQAVEEIAAGKVVQIPAGEKIWFGASASSPLTCIILQGEVG